MNKKHLCLVFHFKSWFAPYIEKGEKDQIGYTFLFLTLWVPKKIKNKQNMGFNFKKPE